MIGMPTSRDLHPLTVESLLATTRTLDRRGIPLDIRMLWGCSLIERARDGILWDFMESDRNRLLFIDSDQVFSPADVMRLLALSTKLDIVASAYVEKKDEPTFAIAKENGVVETGELGCIKVDGLGLGFTMLRKEVVEAVAAKAPLARFRGRPNPMPHIFRCDITDDGAFRGEDIAFFADCRACGYDVWVDPSMVIGHLGPKNFQGKLADLLKAGRMTIDAAV